MIDEDDDEIEIDLGPLARRFARMSRIARAEALVIALREAHAQVCASRSAAREAGDHLALVDESRAARAAWRALVRAKAAYRAAIETPRGR